MENKILFEVKELKRNQRPSIELDIEDHDNAFLELNNLLATKKINEIEIEDIQKVASKYNINLRREIGEKYLEFYKVYLRHCLTDKFLSDEEFDDLKQLKRLFDLSDSDINSIHREIAGEIYRDELEIVLSDGRVDDEEQIFLKKLQDDLRLNDDLVRKIFKESAYDLIRKFINGAILDKRLSPSEEMELESITQSLNITIEFGNLTQKMLDKYKLFWKIENGEVPKLEVNIELEEGEECYYYFTSQWSETENREEHDEDANLDLLVKIAKGIFWTLLNLHPKKINSSTWFSHGKGKVYITNKRIIFIQDERRSTLMLSEVIDLQPHSNGILLSTHLEKDIFLGFNDNVDIVVMMFGETYKHNV